MFSIKDFFGKCDHMHSFQPIWTYLLTKFQMDNFIFWHSESTQWGNYLLKVKNKKHLNINQCCSTVIIVDSE